MPKRMHKAVVRAIAHKELRDLLADLWLFYTCYSAKLPIPFEDPSRLDEIEKMLVPTGGYISPIAGGSFEHTTMHECPKHPGQIPHWRKYKSNDPFQCLLCTYIKYAEDFKKG